jgi:ferrous iron transport protein A
VSPLRRLADLDTDVTIQPIAPSSTSLAVGRRGFAGVITDVQGSAPDSGGMAADELQRRLLEMGFVEGARIEILHEGLIGADPICVRIDDMRVALRRRDARGVLVRPDNMGR